MEDFDAMIQSARKKKGGLRSADDDEDGEGDGGKSRSKSKRVAERNNGDNGDDDHLCPCCGYSFTGKWRWFYGRYGMCPACGALERHRLTCAYIGLKPSEFGGIRDKGRGATFLSARTNYIVHLGKLGFCEPAELPRLKPMQILQIAPDPVGDALSRLPRVKLTRFDREMPQAEVHGDILAMP